MPSATALLPFIYSSEGTSVSVGMVSTFPPTSCGIATFSAALSAGLIGNGDDVNIVRLGESPEMEDPMVLGTLNSGSPQDREAAIDILNSNDVVVIQHEYGLYDGEDGDEVLDLMADIAVPIIVVAHTVLAEPRPHQRLVLQNVCDAADLVVVMTEAGLTRLLDGHGVDADKVVVIPHGAATAPVESSTEFFAEPDDGRPRLLTWGLLGPGKGIEWAIDAVAELSDLDPKPNYIVAGATHPKVVDQDGEAYREMLTDRATNSTAADIVSFDDSYRDLASLTRLIQSADLVVLPYDSTDQVTSGVLVDAIALGVPVVSTAFPHAVELLSSGAGIVVPQRDAAALADAIRSVLVHKDLAASMAAEARRLAPDLSWPAVAEQYSERMRELMASRRVIKI